MALNRRTLLGRTAGAAAAALVPGLLTRPAFAQTATLSSMVFISKRLDASTADYRKWYIEHHAPDFLSFAKPYLTRYTQDFVEKSHGDAVDFDCITEFGYRSHEAQAQLLKVLATPEAERTLAAHPKIGSKPGPHEDHGGSRTFATDEMRLAGPARGADKPGTMKQALLLRRKGPPSPTAFTAAASAFGTAIGQNGKGAERVVLDLAVPETGRPAPLFDAVILIWPHAGADPSAALPPTPDQIEIVNIIDLVAYESPLV